MTAIRKSVQNKRPTSGGYLLRKAATSGSEDLSVVVTSPGTTKSKTLQVGVSPVFGRLAGRIVMADDFDTWPDEMLEAMEGSRR